MNFDRIVSVIAGLGVPGVVLLVAVSATGYAGGAALTTALAALGGPLGMIGGITLLGVLVLIVRALTHFSFEQIYIAVLKKLQEKEDLTEEQIIEKINSYPISRKSKLSIIDKMQSVKTP